jgi:hypothetical protein
MVNADRFGWFLTSENYNRSPTLAFLRFSASSHEATEGPDGR